MGFTTAMTEDMDVDSNGEDGEEYDPQYAEAGGTAEQERKAEERRQGPDRALAEALGFKFSAQEEAAPPRHFPAPPQGAMGGAPETGEWRASTGPPDCILKVSFDNRGDWEDLADDATGIFATAYPSAPLAQGDFLEIFKTLAYNKHEDRRPYLNSTIFTEHPACPFNSRGEQRQTVPNNVTIDIIGMPVESEEEDVQELLGQHDIELVPHTTRFRGKSDRYMKNRGHGVRTAKITCTVHNTIRAWGAMLGTIVIRVHDNTRNPLNNIRGGRRVTITLSGAQSAEWHAGTTGTPPEYLRLLVIVPKDNKREAPERMALARALHFLGFSEGEAGIIMTKVLRSWGIPAMAVAFDDGPLASTKEGGRAALPPPVPWYSPASGIRALLPNAATMDTVLETHGESRITMSLADILESAADIARASGGTVTEEETEKETRDEIERLTTTTVALRTIQNRQTLEAAGPLGLGAGTALGCPLTEAERQRAIHITNMDPKRTTTFVTTYLGRTALNNIHSLQSALLAAIQRECPTPIERVAILPLLDGQWDVRAGIWVVFGNTAQREGRDIAESAAAASRLEEGDTNRFEPLAVRTTDLTRVCMSGVTVNALASERTEWQRVAAGRPPARETRALQKAGSSKAGRGGRGGKGPQPGREATRRQGGNTSAAVVPSPPRPPNVHIWGTVRPAAPPVGRGRGATLHPQGAGQAPEGMGRGCSGAGASRSLFSATPPPPHVTPAGGGWGMSQGSPARAGAANTAPQQHAPQGFDMQAMATLMAAAVTSALDNREQKRIADAPPPLDMNAIMKQQVEVLRLLQERLPVPGGNVESPPRNRKQQKGSDEHELAKSGTDDPNGKGRDHPNGEGGGEGGASEGPSSSPALP